ncbi:hypothetical protein V8E53_007874 [Lactarius tabidus]
MSQLRLWCSHILAHFCHALSFGCAFQEGFNTCLGAPFYGQSLGQSQVFTSLVKDLMQGLMQYPIQDFIGLEVGLVTSMDRWWCSNWLEEGRADKCATAIKLHFASTCTFRHAFS